MKRQIAFWLLIFLPLLKGEESCVGPWFMGPLLTNSPHVVPKGYINFEPFVFYIVDTGIYDNHWNGVDTPDFTSNEYLMPFWVGLTKWMDLEIEAAATWQSVEGVSSFVFNDFELVFDFQLFEKIKKNSIHAIKFYVGETFPTGPYQKLDPDKLLTDIGGKGAFQTTIGLVFGKTFDLPNCHKINVRANPYYIGLLNRVHVKGFNAYGGSFDTDAKVRPRTTWGFLSSIEYNLSTRWALSCDLQALYKTKQTFSGFGGTGPDGNELSLILPKGFQFSLCPGIEYAMSVGMGFVGGLWFTFAGKNESRFFGGTIAFNYYSPIPPKKERGRYRTFGGSGGR